MSVTSIAAATVLVVPLFGQPAGAVPAGGDPAAVGIHVSGGQLVESDGSPLLLRGISHPHTWYAAETGSFADIADAGANAVRVVLSDGTRWTRNGPADVGGVVGLCEENRLICVLEDHDTVVHVQRQLFVAVSGEDEVRAVRADCHQTHFTHLITSYTRQTPSSPARSRRPSRHAAKSPRSYGLSGNIMVPGHGRGVDWP